MIRDDVIRIKKWTREELRELIELYPDTDTEVLMEKFQCTRSAIANKAHRMCLKKTFFYQIRRGKEAHENFDGVRNKARKWTEEEIEQLLLEYPDTDNVTLSQKYGRTRRSINAIAQKHNVFKSTAFRIEFATKNSLLGVKARWGVSK